MARHERNGASLEWHWRGTRIYTPAWLDAARTPSSSWLSRHLGTAGLLRRTYTPVP